MADKKQNPIKFGEVVAKCWEDEAYRKRFIKDPETVLTEAGFVVDEGVTYKVIEQPKLVKYLVIPYENAKDAVQLLAKGFLNQAETKDVIIPEGVEVRIIQNTEDTRYMVLPASPKTLTAAELKMVAGGGSVATETFEVAETVTTVEAHAEIVVGAVEMQTAMTTTTVGAEIDVVAVGILFLI